MRHSLLILAAASALSACGTVSTTADTLRGIEPVNVPVVERQDFAFDAAAPGGSLPLGEAARLDGWFQGLGLTYGDRVYVEGGYSDVRRDVARVAGRYGMMVSDGGPAVAGVIPTGAVRIVVSRTRASVPNCPNWADATSLNYNNRMMNGLGCAVNANLAAMVADPNDLVRGRAGPAAADGVDAAKAIAMYRDWPLTGIIDGQTKRPLIIANPRIK